MVVEHGSAVAALARSQAPGPSAIADAGCMQQLLARHRLHLITWFDADYPPLLRHVPDPPLALYLRGDREALDAPCIAVVGARRCSRAGASLAGRLAKELSAAGVTVVSGLARGIDAAAHRGALHGVVDAAGSGGGRTAAVLGSGLARTYPRTNAPLADAILAAEGVLVSEYPPEMPPARHRFPERNRIISGLSQAVLVVEAGARSGSLITARFALEQGREVLAVPGAVTTGLSAGCHRLLRDGAALVESAGDVLTALGLDPGAPAAPPQVSQALATVLAAMEPGVSTMDQLVAGTGLAAGEIAVRLVELELAGFVQQVPGGYIRRPFSVT